MDLVIFRWMGAGLRDCWLFKIIVGETRPYRLNIKNLCEDFSWMGAGLRNCGLFTIIVGETGPYNLMDSGIGSATAARSGSTASRCASKSARFLMFDL
jgi:hypothetical protein